MGALLSTQRTEAEAEVQLGTFFFPARHPAPEGAHNIRSDSRQLLWANDPVSVTGTIGEALPGHKQSSPGDETESESPGFVNDRVSSTVLRGPRTLTLAIPLTHEHGW